VRKILIVILVSCLCLPQAFGESSKYQFSPTDLTKNIKSSFGWTFGTTLTAKQKQDAGCGEFKEQITKIDELKFAMDFSGYECKSESAPKPFNAFSNYTLNLNRKSILSDVLARGTVSNRNSCVTEISKFVDEYQSKYGNVFQLMDDSESSILWQDKHSSASERPLSYRTIYLSCEQTDGKWTITLLLMENEHGSNPQIDYE
jgi:hypothetical protein